VAERADSGSKRAVGDVVRVEEFLPRLAVNIKDVGKGVEGVYLCQRGKVGTQMKQPYREYQEDCQGKA
jgi:hypothetical protein